MDDLLIEITGLLTILAQGRRPANLTHQAQELLEKLGDNLDWLKK